MKNHFENKYAPRPDNFKHHCRCKEKLQEYDLGVPCDKCVENCTQNTECQAYDEYLSKGKFNHHLIGVFK